MFRHARQDDSGRRALHPKQRLCPRTAHAPGCLQNIRVQCGESHVGVVHHGHDAVNRQGNNGSLVADPAEGDQDAQQGDGGNGVQHVADAHHRRRDTGCSAIQMPVKRPIMPDMAMAVRARPMWASSNPANQSARWAYRPKIPCSSSMSRLRVQAAHCVYRTGLRAAAALEAVRPVDDIGRSGSEHFWGQAEAQAPQPMPASWITKPLCSSVSPP